MNRYVERKTERKHTDKSDIKLKNEKFTSKNKDWNKILILQVTRKHFHSLTLLQISYDIKKMRSVIKNRKWAAQWYKDIHDTTYKINNCISLSVM